MRCWHWQKCTALSRKSLTYCCIHCSMQQMEVGILNAVGELWQLSKCLPETRLKLWNRHMRFVGHSICFSTSTVSDTAISVETSLSTSTPSAQAEMSWGYADWLPYCCGENFFVESEQHKVPDLGNHSSVQVLRMTQGAWRTCPRQQRMSVKLSGALPDSVSPQQPVSGGSCSEWRTVVVCCTGHLGLMHGVLWQCLGSAHWTRSICNRYSGKRTAHSEATCTIATCRTLSAVTFCAKITCQSYRQYLM